MSMSATRTLARIRSAANTRTVLTQRVRPFSSSAFRGRGVVFKGKDDLGGPGGSEHPFKKEAQNRRLYMITGGAVLAVVGIYALGTGKSDKATQVAKEQLKKAGNTPSPEALREAAGTDHSNKAGGRGLGAHRHD